MCAKKDHTDYWPWTNFYSTHANEVGQDGHKNKQEILSFPLFFLLLSLIWAKFPRAIKGSLHNSAGSCIKEQRIVLLNASLGTRELLSSSFQLACTRLSVNIDKRRSRRVIKGWGQTWRLQLSWKHSRSAFSSCFCSQSQHHISRARFFACLDFVRARRRLRFNVLVIILTQGRETRWAI